MSLLYTMENLIKIITAVLVSIPNALSCGEAFTDLAGTFTSPDYDTQNSYPSNSDCEWTISTPEGTNIILIIEDFELKCPYDHLSVTDFSNNTIEPIFKKGCNLDEEIYVLGNILHFRFVSDGSSQQRGFKISWKVKSTLTWHSDFVSVHEAHEICRRDGGDLVKDIAEYQDDIVDMMQERHVTSIWQAKNTYQTPWVWIQGCFNFTTDGDFETYVIVKNNTMAECQRQCRDSNYFGLQRDTCFCLDSFAGPPIVMDYHCTIPCTGNIDERCGGNQSLTIYMNDICYENSSAWQGTVSRTNGGNICLPWNNITAVVNDNTTVFADGSALNASNYCRNPNGSEALWCYISQNETELCDVPPCFNKGTSNQNCMAMYKSYANEFKFIAFPCNRNERALCYDIDDDGYVINSKRTWSYHRQNLWTGSQQICKSLVGPSFFFMNKNRLVTNNFYYWIGQYRSSKTSTQFYSGVDYHKCYTIGVNNDVLSEEVTDCDSKRHFICQTIPVTCGGNFNSLDSHSFSTPGYPGGYSPLSHCNWTIHVPEMYYINLTIDVDIEDTYQCRYDYLNIYFGTSTHDNLNSTLCGRIVQVFDHVLTNVTLEFLSDDDKNSRGINVTWSTMPMTTTSPMTTSTMINTTTQKFSRQVYVQDSVDLSNGALAGIIVAVLILLVLSCLGGYLFGTRGRPLLGREQDTRHEDTTDNSGYVNGGIRSHSIDTLDHGYSRTKSFTKDEFDEHPSNREPLNTTQNLDKHAGTEVRGNVHPLYSVVNKNPNGMFSPAPSDTTSGNKAVNKHDSTYNRLHENHDDTADKKPVNVYNRLHERDPLYNNTVSSASKQTGSDVPATIDTYHHKKSSP